MLRNVLIGCVALGLCGCLLAIATGVVPLWGPAIWLAIALVLMVFERRGYKQPEATAPPSPWRPTEERFVDPESGALVRVFFNPDTGERRYIAENR